MIQNPFQLKTFKGGYSTELAIGTFAIGTLLFLLYYLFPTLYQLITISLFYLLFAFIANGIMLLYLLYLLIILPKQREYITIKILTVLSNIPIAILYLYCILNFFY